MKPIKNKPYTIPPPEYKLNVKSNNWVYCPDPKIINPKTGRCIKQKQKQIKQIENIIKMSKKTEPIKKSDITQKKSIKNIESILKNAINEREFETIRDLISSGSLKDVNVEKILKEVNKITIRDFGTGILENAINLDRDIDIVKFYVKNGIDVNSGALTKAIAYGHLDIVKFLVESGAKSDFAVSNAIEYGQLDILKYLIKRGAVVTDDLLNELPNYGIWADTKDKAKIAEAVKFLKSVYRLKN